MKKIGIDIIAHAISKTQTQAFKVNINDKVSKAVRKFIYLDIDQKVVINVNNEIYYVAMNLLII